MASIEETYEHFLDPMKARWDAPFETQAEQANRLSRYAAMLTDYPVGSLLAGFKALQSKHAGRPKWPTLNHIEIVMRSVKPETQASLADWDPNDPPWVRADREAKQYALAMMDVSAQAADAEQEGWGRYWLDCMTSRARETLRLGLPVEQAGDSVSEDAATYGRQFKIERKPSETHRPVAGFDLPEALASPRMEAAE